MPLKSLTDLEGKTYTVNGKQDFGRLIRVHLGD